MTFEPLTKKANEVFSDKQADGSNRAILAPEALVWGTEIENRLCAAFNLISKSDSNNNVSSSKLPSLGDTLESIQTAYSRSTAVFFNRDEVGISDSSGVFAKVNTNVQDGLIISRSTPKFVRSIAGPLAASPIDTKAIAHENNVAIGYAVADNAENLSTHSNNPASMTIQDRVTFGTDTKELFDGVPLVKVIPNTDNNTHRIRNNAPEFVAGQQYCFSFIGTNGDAPDTNLIQFSTPDGIFNNPLVNSARANLNLDLRSGAIQRIDSEFTEWGTDYFNGLPRFWWTATALQSGTGATTFIQLLNDAGQSAFQGNGTDGILWGNYQINSGTRPDIPIITTSSSVAVGDDRLSMPLEANFFKGRSISISIDYEDFLAKGQRVTLFSFSDGNKSISIDARNNTTKLIEVHIDFGVPEIIESKRLAPEGVKTNIRLDISNDQLGLSEATLYINGERQGIVGLSGVDFSGVWTQYFGKAYNTNIRQASVTIENTIIVAENPPAPLEAINTISAVGPSITYDDINGVSLDQFYPAIVARQLGEHVKSYNFAESGTNTMEGLIEQLPGALATKPQILFIDTGNFRTSTIASGATVNSLTINGNSSVTSRFKQGSYVTVSLPSGESETVKLDTYDEATGAATVTPDMTAPPLANASIVEAVSRNVQEMCEQAIAIGATPIVLGFPYENFATGGDTLTTQPNRLDDRQRAKAGADAATGAIYSDQYASAIALIKAGIVKENDDSGHVAPGDGHYNAFGQRYLRAEGVLSTLKSIGYDVQTIL